MDHPKPRNARETFIEGLFKEWVEMGDQRSYGKLGRKHGIEGPDLLRHAKAFLWPERINALAAQHNEETSTEPEIGTQDPNEANVNRLHLGRLKILQQKAMTYLENCTFDKPDTALRMLIEAMKLQRDILGLSKDKDDDLRSILLGRLKEMEPAPAPGGAAPPAPEFAYNPDLQIPQAPNGPEGNPSPASS